MDGRVGIDTFEVRRLHDPAIRAMMARVSMRVDDALGRSAPPLTQARVRVRLRNGSTLERDAYDARGYPDRPATPAEVDAKFTACATRRLAPDRAAEALASLRRRDELSDVGELASVLVGRS